MYKAREDYGEFYPMIGRAHTARANQVVDHKSREPIGSEYWFSQPIRIFAGGAGTGFILKLIKIYYIVYSHNPVS